MGVKLSDVLPFVLPHEGDISDDPGDPGGYTKWGISLRFLQQLGDQDHNGVDDGDVNLDGIVDWHDVHDLTVEDMVRFYDKMWVPGGCWRLVDRSVAAKTFDSQVNRGIRNGTKNLQRAVNAVVGKDVLSVDGGLGPITASWANVLTTADLVQAIAVAMADDYVWLVSKRPDLAKFKRGWLNRAKDIPEWK